MIWKVFEKKKMNEEKGSFFFYLQVLVCSHNDKSVLIKKIVIITNRVYVKRSNI